MALWPEAETTLGATAEGMEEDACCRTLETRDIGNLAIVQMVGLIE